MARASDDGSPGWSPTRLIDFVRVGVVRRQLAGRVVDLELDGFFFGNKILDEDDAYAATGVAHAGSRPVDAYADAARSTTEDVEAP